MTGGPCPRLTLTLWTNDAELARAADEAGVDRIGCDLEHRGKRRRQHGQGTWLSPHVERDLQAVGAVLTDAALFVRVDAPSRRMLRQIDRVIDAGVRVVMLPMSEEPRRIERAVARVAARARVIALVETRRGVDNVDEIARSCGIDEVHIGLNDLSFELGMANRFCVLTDGVVDRIADAVHSAGIPLGVGGIARPDDVTLPVAPDLVYAQLARLRATTTLLARSFLRPGRDGLAEAVLAARARFTQWWERSPAELEEARVLLERAVAPTGTGRL